MGNEQNSFKIEGLVNKKFKKPEVITINAHPTTFPVKSTDEIAIGLNLMKLARESGSLNLPASTQTTHYGTDERKIDVAIDDVAKQYHEKAITLITNLDKQFNADENDTLSLVNETRLLPHEFKRKVREYQSNQGQVYGNILTKFRNNRIPLLQIVHCHQRAIALTNNKFKTDTCVYNTKSDQFFIGVICI